MTSQGHWQSHSLRKWQCLKNDAR